MKPPRNLKALVLTMGVSAFAGACAGVLAQSITLQPGQYEAMTQMSLPAGSPVKMPAMKDVVCLTSADTKNLANKMMAASKDSDCKVIEQSPTATGIKFTTECKVDEGPRVRMTADVTFTSSESYREVVHMTGASDRGGSAQVPGTSFTVTAKRIGDCAK